MEHLYFPLLLLPVRPSDREGDRGARGGDRVKWGYTDKSIGWDAQDILRDINTLLLCTQALEKETVERGAVTANTYI